MKSRREQILGVAAQLFAKHGYHGVSISDLGGAVGISGPALYRHFPGKEALLEEMLVGISEYLLQGGQALAAGIDDPHELLRELVAFQTGFATREPELIVVQDRDLANLAPGPRAKIRRLQRTYVEIWVDALRGIRPDLDDAQLLVVAHGTFGLLNSTPHAGRGRAAAEILQGMALAALAAR